MHFLVRHRFLVFGAAFIVFAAVAYGHYFGPVDRHAFLVTTVVVSPEDTLATLADRLVDADLVKNRYAFEIAYLRKAGGIDVRPGGFSLSQNMDAWTLAETLTEAPYQAFVRIPRGRRKEEIADLLQAALKWSPSQRESWMRASDAWAPPYTEGVYFPDTYLIPADEAPEQVAVRMRERFIEAFDPLEKLAQERKIPWPEVVTMASLLEREAAGPGDMPLIAGILWNRLDKNMRLQVDATLQYIKGSEGNWWGTVTKDDKYLVSDFNTYQHEGLPPSPIANPGIDSLTAVLNPETTSCLYYLHDARGQIHCSPNYSGHLANIRKYLQ